MKEVKERSALFLSRFSRRINNNNVLTHDTSPAPHIRSTVTATWYSTAKKNKGNNILAAQQTNDKTNGKKRPVLVISTSTNNQRKKERKKEREK